MLPCITRYDWGIFKDGPWLQMGMECSKYIVQVKNSEVIKAAR